MSVVDSIKRGVAGAAEAVLPPTPESCVDLAVADAERLRCEERHAELHRERAALEARHPGPDARDLWEIGKQAARAWALRERWSRACSRLRLAAPPAPAAPADPRIEKAREVAASAVAERARAEAALAEAKRSLQAEEERQAGPSASFDEKKLAAFHDRVSFAMSRVRVAVARADAARKELARAEEMVRSERRTEILGRLRTEVARLDKALVAACAYNEAVVAAADDLRGLGVSLGPLQFPRLDGERIAFWRDQVRAALGPEIA